MEAKKLIDDCTRKTKVVLQRAKMLRTMNLKILNHKPNADSWSVLEVVAHINLYSDFYNPEFEQRIRSGKRPHSVHFKPGVLGNYFQKSMLPKNGVVKNKMKTFKDKVPVRSELGMHTLEKFIKQHEELLRLLERARDVNLTKTRVSITISKYLKLRLGDGFRFIINHTQRHFLQLENVLESMPAEAKIQSEA